MSFFYFCFTILLGYGKDGDDMEGQLIQFPGNKTNNYSPKSGGGKIIQFPAKKETEDDDMSLSDWVSIHPSEDELKEVFLNMDVAMKYIHDRGYCVEVFHPSKIYVLDERPDHIKFSTIPLPDDYATSEQMIKEDIFNSSLVQIGIYTKTLNSLTPQFLKDNFDEISQFVPASDVPYYRGVVQRGAKVYLSEFAAERSKRDLESLEEQLGTAEDEKIDTSKFEPVSNDAINDNIYKSLNRTREAAFANYLIIPTLILLSLFIIGLVGWIISLF